MSNPPVRDPFSSAPRGRLPFRQVGAYKLVGLLGDGTGSSRYLCRQDDHSPLRTLELTTSVLEGPAREQLRRAVEEAGRLTHPGLLPPLEVGEHNGRMFVVTEHVPGPSLAERLEREGAPPRAEALEIACQLLEAMAAAHSRGVLHLGIEPGSIALDPHTGRPRLGGFGLGAVATQVRLTSSARDGAPPRGLHYQAPELLSSHLPPDARADVFSLGVVLYELLTRARPFTGRTTAELVERLRVGGAQAPSRRVEGIDPRLDEVILAALAQNPQGRPRNAGSFLQGLRAATRTAPAPEGGGTQGRLVALAAGLAAGLILAAWPALGAVVARGREDGLRVALADERGALTALESERQRLAGLEAQAEPEPAGAEASQGDPRESEAAQARAAAAQEYAGVVRRARAQPRGELARLGAGVLIAAERLPGTARLRARWWASMGEPRRALEAIAEARAERSEGADPDLDLVVWELLARLQLGEGDAVREGLRELSEQHGDSPQGLWARGFDTRLPLADRIAMQEEAIERAPEAGYLRVALHRLLDASLRGALDERALRRGLEVAEAGLRLDPLDLELLFMRSSDRYNQWLVSRRREDALRQDFMADLLRARAISPRPHLWSYAAKTWCVLQRPACALVEANQAVELGERGTPVDHSLALSWQGLALWQLGRADDALRAWEAGLERYPQPEMGQVLNELPRADQRLVLDRLSPPARARLEQALAR